MKTLKKITMPENNKSRKKSFIIINFFSFKLNGVLLVKQQFSDSTPSTLLLSLKSHECTWIIWILFIM